MIWEPCSLRIFICRFWQRKDFGGNPPIWNYQLREKEANHISLPLIQGSRSTALKHPPPLMIEGLHLAQLRAVERSSTHG